MYEMPLVAEFEARPRLAPYASELAEYLRGIPSPDSSQKLQQRFLAFIRWAEQLESENDLEVLSLPVDPTYAIIYALDMDRRGLALTTTSNYMSAVGTVHRALGFHAPTLHPMARRFLAYLRTKHASTDLRKAAALSEDEVTRILDTLNTPRRTRGGRVEMEQQADERASLDRALLLTMIEAGLRRGEAANLTWRDVNIRSSGPLHAAHPRNPSVYVRIRPSRSDASRRMVRLSRDCSQALMAIQPGGVDRRERVFGLSDSQIVRRLKAMCEAAGGDSANVSGNTPRATLLRRLRDRLSPVESYLRDADPSQSDLLQSLLDELASGTPVSREQIGWPDRTGFGIAETSPRYFPEPDDLRPSEQ